MRSYDPKYKRRLIERFKDALDGDEYVTPREFAQGYGIPHTVFSEWLREAGIKTGHASSGSFVAKQHAR